MGYGDFVILIPAINESKAIGKVLQDLTRAGFDQIVVVNDGSMDDTKEIAYENGAHVISHELTLGYGGATISGFEFIQNSKLFSNATHLITVDGDGQHDIQDVIKIAEKARSGTDFIIGARVMKKKQAPTIKILINNLADILAAFITGKYVKGINSGLKCIKIDKLSSLKLSLKDYSFSAEFSIEAIRKGLNVQTVEVQAIYTEYSKTKSIKPQFSKILKFTGDLLDA